MSHNPDIGSTMPEFPMDEEIANLLNEVGLSKKTINLVRKLLTDGSSMFLESDKKWVRDQIKRIAGASNKTVKDSLKSAFYDDLEKRKEQFPR
jgi:hypothetical protein